MSTLSGPSLWGRLRPYSQILDYAGEACQRQTLCDEDKMYNNIETRWQHKPKNVIKLLCSEDIQIPNNSTNTKKV